MQNSVGKPCTGKPRQSEVSIVNDLLINKKFNECLETCLRGIAEADNSNDRASTVESLCVVAIQAYSELNRWQEVLPFVTQLYNGIEDCPSRIVQLCVLLHAYMRDYTTCSAIAHIWLRNPRNISSPSYANIVQIYLSNVVIPQKKWKDVEPFLENCSGLNSDVKNNLQRQIYMVQKRDEELAEAARVKALERPKETDKNSTELTEPYAPFPISWAISIYNWIAKFIPRTFLRFISRLALFSIFMYWLLIKGYLDFVSNRQIKNLLSSLAQLWKSMFAPFYMIKS